MATLPMIDPDAGRLAWDNRRWPVVRELAKTPEGRAEFTRQYWALHAHTAAGGFFYNDERRQLLELGELLEKVEEQVDADRADLHRFAVLVKASKGRPANPGDGLAIAEKEVAEAYAAVQQAKAALREAEEKLSRLQSKQQTLSRQADKARIHDAEMPDLLARLPEIARQLALEAMAQG